MYWFRFWNKTLDSRKVQTLPGETFKAWVNLLCVASQEDKDGKLPGMADIAWSLRTTPEKAKEYVDHLVSAGLLDRDGPTCRIHKWEKWQRPAGDATAAERMRRHRARKRAKKDVDTVIDPVVPSEVEMLRSLPYEDYLNTSHWAAVRDFAIGACRGRCSLCNAKGTLHVHHRTYETLGEERPGDVIGLCGSCHEAFHEHRRLRNGPAPPGSTAGGAPTTERISSDDA